MRALRELGIAIIFEEQNINTLESDGELLITLLGAVSQGESEAISENVKWGKRQAMVYLMDKNFFIAEAPFCCPFRVQLYHTGLT